MSLFVSFLPFSIDLPQQCKGKRQFILHDKGTALTQSLHVTYLDCGCSYLCAVVAFGEIIAYTLGWKKGLQWYCIV